MANILSLALKVTGDTTGLRLGPVQRALVNLGDQTDKLTGQFTKFAADSDAAAKAQGRFAAQAQELVNTLRDGGGATEFAAGFERLAKAAAEEAAAFERAAKITEQYRTATERFDTVQAELKSQLDAGRISAETYGRAVEGAASGLTEAERASRGLGVSAEASAAALEKAERARQATLAEGQRVAEKYATAEEKRASKVAKLDALLADAAISEDTYNRALADVSGANEAAAKAEKARADALAAASRIIQANLTPQEKYDQQMVELRGHLEAGRLSQEQFNRAAEKAGQDLAKTSNEAGKTDKSLQSLNKNVALLKNIEIGRLLIDGLRAVTGVIQSVTSQITGLVSSVNSSLDTLNDFSARTGIGVEALQGYSLAAKLAGVDTEAFGAAVQKLAVNIGKANPGDSLDKSLRGINLSVTELRALSPEEQFSAIGNAISQLPTAADRAAAAVQVFGKQGAALAPLFREGAASIEELQARAERLGIIVSETQINNVADMNDAFDLVSATISGITGQVIGNLAPAVTAVVDEFLTFIEEWSGAEGSGGTGIANAITDVLLNGAEAFAGVFDSIVPSFTGFTTSLESVAAVFSVIGNVLTAAVESLRIVFNVFESIGNAIALALGKVLEGLGSWVSSDMEQFGKDLQENARASLKQNEKDLESAATNVAVAVTSVFTGQEGSPAAAGDGAATKFLAGVRQRIEAERVPEFKINTNIEETRERFDTFFGGLVDNSSAVADAMRGFEAAVAAVEDPLNITAEEIKRIEEAQKNVNTLIDQEQRARADAAEAATAQSEAVDKLIAASQEQARIDKEFGGDSARAKAADNLLLVQQEIVRVEKQLAAARDAGDQKAIDAATSRLASLDQVEAREQDIASGAAKRREQAARDAERLDEQIFEKQAQLLQRQFEIESQRAEELANVRTGSVEINDLRSGGISAFFDTLQEDPAIAEAKKQTQELQKMRQELAKLQAERVDILAGTG